MRFTFRSFKQQSSRSHSIAGRLLTKLSIIALVAPILLAPSTQSAMAMTGPDCTQSTTGAPGPQGQLQLPAAVTTGSTLLNEFSRVDSQGRIVVFGTIKDVTTQVTNVFVARYLPTGALDTSFGTSGYMYLSFAAQYQYAYLNACALAFDSSDGMLVVAQGAFTNDPSLPSPNEHFLDYERLNPDGSENTNWGHVGEYSDVFTYPSLADPSVSVPQQVLLVNGLAIQSDGSLVMAGSFAESPNSGHQIAWLEKFDSYGGQWNTSSNYSLLNNYTYTIPESVAAFRNLTIDSSDNIYLTLFMPAFGTEQVTLDTNGVYDFTHSSSAIFQVLVPNSPIPENTSVFEYPAQKSSIASISPETATVGSTLQVTVNGNFLAPIQNIVANGVRLAQGSWVQTPTQVTFSLAAAKAGPISILLYNGQAPVLAAPVIMVNSPVTSWRSKHPLKTIIECHGQGHAIKHVLAVNPVCPDGFTLSK